MPPYVPPGPSGMPQGYSGPYAPGGYAAPSASGGGGNMPGPVDVEPGAWIQIEEERLELEKYIADLEADLARATDATARAEIANRLRIAQMDYDQKQRETELALATSPIDFVAYETYKREVQKAAGEGRPRPSPSSGGPGGIGWNPLMGERQAMEEEMAGGWSPSGPVGTVHTDAEIHAMLAEMTGIEHGRLGGALGAAVPTTQQFSRSGFGDMSDDEKAVLASFLRAGVGEMGTEGKTSIDPAEYYREMEEGFVPTMRETGPTGYNF